MASPQHFVCRVPKHPDIALFLNNLAFLATALNGLSLLDLSQKRYDEAEPRFQRALTIWEKAYGPEHPRMIGALKSLAAISVSQERYEEAEQMFRRASQIQEKTSWSESSV